MHNSAENFPNGESYRLMSGLAEKHGITIHAGSVAERDGDDFYNATVVFGPNGRQIAHYRKIHLFDVDAPGGTSYRRCRKLTGAGAESRHQTKEIPKGKTPWPKAQSHHYANLGDVVLLYVTAGYGPPVVLLHGWLSETSKPT